MKSTLTLGGLLAATTLLLLAGCSREQAPEEGDGSTPRDPDAEVPEGMEGGDEARSGDAMQEVQR